GCQDRLRRHRRRSQCRARRGEPPRRAVLPHRGERRARVSDGEPMRTPIDGARCTIGPTDAASGARGRSAAVVVALAVALAGAGCAPVAVLPYVADRPPTVTLPIAQA